MIDSTLTATRVQGGWWTYNSKGEYVMFISDPLAKLADGKYQLPAMEIPYTPRPDHHKMTVRYSRTYGDVFKISTMIDRLEKPIPGLQRKAKQR